MATYTDQRNAILPIHFFKIILKTNVERLKIPNKFTRIYGGDLPNPVFVKPPDGTEWKVHLTKQNGEVWFEKGWKEFAENYSLDYGHLVFFKYKGTSYIDVIILDQSALEIDYPCYGSTDEEDNLDQRSDASIKILEEMTSEKNARPKSCKKMRIDTDENVQRNSKLHADACDKFNQGIKLQKRVKHRPESMKAIQRTSSLNLPRMVKAQEVAKKFASNNPFFTLFIKPPHLEENAKKHVPKFIDIKGSKQNVMIRLEKRLWSVKLVCSSKNATYDRFTSGWSSFAKESKLQAGDVCIFELIDKQVPLLEVHIFKS